jgi:eukaryotic-like serine/threonine-protein kinase
VAYALLAGEPYWAEERFSDRPMFELFGMLVEGPKEPPCKRALRRRGAIIPPAFDAWFAKATARRPEDRFPRASEGVTALADALRVPLPRSPSVPAPAHSSQRRLAAAAAQAVQTQLATDGSSRTGPTGAAVVTETLPAAGVSPAGPHPAPHRVGRWVALAAALGVIALLAVALVTLRAPPEPRPAPASAPAAGADAGAADAGHP